MQSISISLRHPLAEFVINCALSDCIKNILCQNARKSSPIIHVVSVTFSDANFS